MRNSDSSFKHESLQDTASIQSLLKAITKGLAEGRLTFSDEYGEIVMEPEGLLQLKFSATRENSLSKINLRISWQVEEAPKQKRKPISVKTGGKD